MANTALDKATIQFVPFGGKASKLYSRIPTNGDADWTITRNSPAWRINESGAWESVASNVPRIHFKSPSCGKYRREPERENLFLNSATGVTQSITVSSGQEYSVSFSGTGSITFSGDASGTLNGTGATVYDRVETQITPSGTSVTCTISGTVEYVNFELGSFATTWMETSGAPVTRNAETTVLTGVGDYLGDAEGSIYVEVEPLDLSSFGTICLHSASTGNDDQVSIGFNSSGDAILGITKNNGTLITLSSETLSLGVTYRLAGGYAPQDSALAVNGLIVATGESETLEEGDLDTIRFTDGNGSSFPLWGDFGPVIIFNRRLINSELSDISA